jgi:hypothetical protein
MGSKRHRKKQFLASHPMCCFCGGNTPSEEIDHIPSRVLFDNRQWPEGYEYPACESCNRASRHDEQIVAMLSRIYPDAETEEGEKEVYDRIRAVAHNYPGLLEEMKPTVRQVRNVLKRYGIEKLEGMSTTELPFLSVSGPLVNGAVENFGRKLFLALYYKHTGKVLPQEGGIAIRWYSNLQIENDEIPKGLANIVSGFPKLERCSMNLYDQFFYRYGAADNKKVAALLAFFRRSFAILGFVNRDAKDFDLPEDATILGPYRHEKNDHKVEA